LVLYLFQLLSSSKFLVRFVWLNLYFWMDYYCGLSWSSATHIYTIVGILENVRPTYFICRTLIRTLLLVYWIDKMKKNNKKEIFFCICGFCRSIAPREIRNKGACKIILILSKLIFDGFYRPWIIFFQFWKLGGLKEFFYKKFYFYQIDFEWKYGEENAHKWRHNLKGINYLWPDYIILSISGR